MWLSEYVIFCSGILLVVLRLSKLKDPKLVAMAIEQIHATDTQMSRL
jgi:hypothetical protein